MKGPTRQTSHPARVWAPCLPQYSCNLHRRTKFDRVSPVNGQLRLSHCSRATGHGCNLMDRGTPNPRDTPQGKSKVGCDALGAFGAVPHPWPAGEAAALHGSIECRRASGHLCRAADKVRGTVGFHRTGAHGQGRHTHTPADGWHAARPHITSYIACPPPQGWVPGFSLRAQSGSASSRGPREWKK